MIWHAGRNASRVGLLAATLALFLGAGAGHAQTLVTIQNSKLAVSVGQEGDLNGVGVAGRFGITEAADTANVLLQLPRDDDLGQVGSYVTVRIDGGTPFLPDGTVAEGVAGWDIAWGAEDTPDTDITGEWLQVPTAVSPTRIVAKWHTVPDPEAEPRIPEIQVDLDLRLVYDLVIFRFTVTNKDTQAHTVGLRFAQDFDIPGQTEDGPVYTPRTAGITNEISLISTFIPSFWKAAAKQGTSSVGALLLPGGVSGIPNQPDRLVFGRTEKVCGVLWDFVPDSTETFADALTDGAAAVYYNPTQYAPGQSKTVTMTFGALGSSYEIGQRLVAGLEGPSALTYDPTQPADKQLQPNPFKVTAFLYNMNTVALTNVRAVLSLPEGLALAPNQTAVKTAASVAVDGAVAFTWDVVPTATKSGRLTYSVSLSADPGGQGVSVARNLDIPALPSQGFGAGWQMVTFPYVLDDRTPAGAINLNPALYDLVRWNPTRGHYEAVQFINPGEGYWLRMAAPGTITLVNAQPVKVAGGVMELRLQPGWNQIGNPFLLQVRWGDFKVMNLDPSDRDYLRPLSVAEASDITRQWISPTIYYYDTAANMYKFDLDFATDLMPFVGYWIRVNRPNLVLLVPEPTSRAVKEMAGTRAARTSGDGWLLRLQVSDGRSQDGWNYIGIGRDARDGLDARDVYKPPAPTEGVSLAIVRDDLGVTPERLAQDVRSARGTVQSWRLAVSSTEPNRDVVLTWPNLSSLPRTHELYVSVEGSSARQPLRQSSSLRINTGPAGTRMVTITAEPRAAGGALRITSWSVAQSRSRSSATIAVATNQAASLTVRVLSSSGIALRQLTSRAAGAGQIAQITWDLRDGKGIAVPAGSYTIEVKAYTADGQTARVLAPMVVTR